MSASELASILVRPLSPADYPAWVRLRGELWPDLASEALAGEAAALAERSPDYAAFVAETADGEMVGFIEASLRPWAEGCETQPVGYVEGWYVRPALRNHGLGRRLVEAAEAWARSRGCSEMASDALVDNHESHAAHLRLGYEEVERVVLYRKTIG